VDDSFALRLRIHDTPQLRDFRGKLALSNASLLTNLGNQSHLSCISVPHNDDFVVAFT